MKIWNTKYKNTLSIQYKIQNTLATPFIDNYKKENYENLLTKNSRQKYKKAKKTREKIMKIYKQIYTSKIQKKTLRHWWHIYNKKSAKDAAFSLVFEPFAWISFFKVH